MRQTSSCEFSYSTQTRSINEALLVESERRSRRLAEADAIANRFADNEVSLQFAEIAGDVITEDELFDRNQTVDFGYAGGARFWQSLDANFDVDSDGAVEQMQNPMMMQRRWSRGSTATPEAMSFYVQMNGRGGSSRGRGSQAAQLGDIQQTQESSLWGANAPTSISHFGRVDSKSLQRRDVTINGLTSDGKLMVVNGMSDDEVDQLNQLAGVRMFGQAISGETGFWDPVILTDQDGKAEIEITMPAVSTAWKLSASAISADTLAGSESVDLVTRKTLFGQLRVPQAFTVGDKADIRVEVHNSLEGPRTINVALKATMGSQSLEQNKTIEVKDAGIETLTFPVEIVESDQVQFALTIGSEGEAGDSYVSTADVLPYGFPVYQTASGSASQNTLAMIQLEPNQKTRGQSLELMIGGDRRQSLLDSLVRGETFLPVRCVPTSLLARSVSDCLGGVAVLNSIRRSAPQDSPEGAQVSGIIAGAVSHLIASQRDDGGWSLAGHSAGPADPISTARAMWALVHARRAGFAVPERQFELGIASLKKAFAGETDLNRQAVLLAALAECGAGDFALATRLYRERNRLDD